MLSVAPAIAETTIEFNGRIPLRTSAATGTYGEAMSVSHTHPPAHAKSRPRPIVQIAVGVAGVAAALAVGLAVVGGADPRSQRTANDPEQMEPEVTPTPETAPDVLDGIELDALQRTHIDALRAFALWLDDNDAQGFVGELGWPADADSPWNPLGEAWYQVAEQEGLWTAAWAAGSAWPEEYPLVTYGDGGSGMLDFASAHGLVIESLEAGREPSTGDEARHGVNIAGLEFGDATITNASPGELGTDYFAEPVPSYAWLAERGIDLVRLPVRWERLQPELGEDFDTGYVATVAAQLDAAEAAGIDVILDLHNYGMYSTEAGQVRIGTAELPGHHLSDVWLGVSQTWGDHAALLGYGLMNEPNSLLDDSAAAADLWEEITQETVTSLREAGDDHLLLIAGYDWSSLSRWQDIHPTAWIDDPADNIRYEAHHYWDEYGVGAYASAYADELAAVSDP